MEDYALDLPTKAALVFSVSPSGSGTHFLAQIISQPRAPIPLCQKQLPSFQRGASTQVSQNNTLHGQLPSLLGTITKDFYLSFSSQAH